MTKLEELKVAAALAALAELEAACDVADAACDAAYAVAWYTYKAELKKIQEENSNDC
jgi:hypothetical protein